MQLDEVLPNIDPDHFRIPSIDDFARSSSTHGPRILMLYGSVRQRSFSRMLAEEAGVDLSCRNFPGHRLKLIELVARTQLD
jgi:hypothetical protein